MKIVGTIIKQLSSWPRGVWGRSPQQAIGLSVVRTSDRRSAEGTGEGRSLSGARSFWLVLVSRGSEKVMIR